MASLGFLEDQKDEAAKSTVWMYRYLMDALLKFARELLVQGNIPCTQRWEKDVRKT
jgi:hypothetical protein